MARQVDSVDFKLFRAINDLPNSWRWFFLVSTQLGGATVVVSLFFYGIFSDHVNWALKMLLYSFVTLLTTLAIKAFVSRPRPSGLLKGVHRRSSFTLNRHAFPSSHTANATVLALLSLHVLPVHLWWLAPLWILLVAISRIYLGAHMPVDVAGGFTVGGLIYLMGFVIEKLALKA